MTVSAVTGQYLTKKTAQTLAISSMAMRNSSLGSTGGFRLLSRTALVYRSSVRKHTSCSPNCCSSVSPYTCNAAHALPLPWQASITVATMLTLQRCKLIHL